MPGHTIVQLLRVEQKQLDTGISLTEKLNQGWEILKFGRQKGVGL